MVLHWRASGAPLTQIADDLNAMNNRTPQGAKWYASSVRAVPLRNRPTEYMSLLKDAGNGSIPLLAGSTAGREPAQRGGMLVPYDIKGAERMLNLFTSVGARSFVVTKLDVEQRHLWGKNYSAVELRGKLAAMVRTADIRRPHTLANGQTVMAGENLIVRPVGDPLFVQLDDLSTDQLERVKPAAFLMHSTSPGNHQAWIAVSDVHKAEAKDIMRRVRKSVGGADESASGATRLAGTENWKIKNLPEPPIVFIVCGVPGCVMTPERLQAMGLLAEAEKFAAEVNARRKAPVSSLSARAWPSYEKALAGAPPNSEGTGPSRSHADYWFCYLSKQWGHESEDIMVRLMEVSENARERSARGDAGYARITVENAGAAVARNYGKGRSRA